MHQIVYLADYRDVEGAARPLDDEATLVRRAASGDRGAIERLCLQNWRQVYRSFARYATDPAEAEDLTQEVFLRALPALPRFVDQGVPYRAYLLRIAASTERLICTP